MKTSIQRNQNIAQKPFTLIELIIVVAVILLLLTFLKPSLVRAIESGHLAKCISQQQQLTAAWMLYADDNDGLFASADDSTSANPRAWVNDASREEEKSTEKGTDPEFFYPKLKQGSLYPYLRSVGVYRCPKDERHALTYQMTTAYNWPEKEPYYEKMDDISNPGESILFVEEDTWRNAAKDAYWCRDAKYGSGQPWKFRDDLATYHLFGATFSFADGSVEYREWETYTIRTAAETFFGRTGKNYGNVWGMSKDIVTDRSFKQQNNADFKYIHNNIYEKKY